LENLRAHIRNRSATLIQSVWRGWQLRRINNLHKFKKDLISSNMNQVMSKINFSS
jgi:IQ calmodulin-binding motif